MTSKITFIFDDEAALDEFVADVVGWVIPYFEHSIDTIEERDNE